MSNSISVSLFLEYRILVFMAADEQFTENLTTPLLNKVTKSIIGGVFPELLYKGERKKSGVLLIPLDFQLNTQLIDLTHNSSEVIEQLSSIENQSLEQSSCLFVFADALSQGKEVLIESLFNFFGIHPTYIGGGAGSLHFKPFKCIINNEGFHENSAVIGWGNKKIAIGVAHGWESITEPLKVTKSHNNEVIGINWRPAFEVYKEIVEEHCKEKFTDHNFFEIAKSYPLGISKMDSEKIIRDPFMVSTNTLHFIDVINEGSYVEIMHGNIDLLLQGAKNATKNAYELFDGDINNANIMCIDCISRVLYMGENFKRELNVIDKNATAFGIFSIGEIANSDTILEIYNKTVVLTVW